MSDIEEPDVIAAAREWMLLYMSSTGVPVMSALIDEIEKLRTTITGLQDDVSYYAGTCSNYLKEIENIQEQKRSEQ